MLRTRRAAPVLLSLVALALGTAGCGAGVGNKDYVPAGGVDATNGRIIVDDVWVDGPAGVAAHGSVGLRLYLANDSRHDDALVGVSTPVARHTRLVLHGRPVHRMPIPAWGAVNLEWPSRGSEVRLVDLTHALRPGQWFPVTFQFENSASIIMHITAGPLG